MQVPSAQTTTKKQVSHERSFPSRSEGKNTTVFKYSIISKSPEFKNIILKYYIYSKMYLKC